MVNELMNAVLAEEPREADAAMVEVSWKAACVAQSTKAGWRSFQ